MYPYGKTPSPFLNMKFSTGILKGQLDWLASLFVMLLITDLRQSHSASSSISVLKKSGGIFNRLLIYNLEGIPRYSIVRTGHRMWIFTIWILGIGACNRKHTLHVQNRKKIQDYFLLHHNVPLIYIASCNLMSLGQPDLNFYYYKTIILL